MPYEFFSPIHSNSIRFQFNAQSEINVWDITNIASPKKVLLNINNSDIYFDAWKEKLKGVTVYREGSRHPILSTEGVSLTDFQTAKNNSYRLANDGEEKTIMGDDIIKLPDGRLTTVYHYMNDSKTDDSKIKKTIKEEAIKLITTNNAKVSFPGFGTSSTTALAGDTTVDDVSAANLKTALEAGFGSNAVNIGDSNDTISIPGNLTVSGTTTTINTEAPPR